MLRQPRGAPEETQVLVEERIPPPPPGAPVEEPPPDRALWPFLLILLVLVLAGLAAAYIATRYRHHHRSSSPPTTAAVTRAAAPKPLPKPAPKPAAAAKVTVPKLVGLTAPTALTSLRQLGLNGTTRGVFSSKPRNTVVSERPAAGSKLAKGTTVALDVSKGQKSAAVPDVVGQDSAAAIATLKAQGFATTIVKVPSAQPAGQVVAQHPAAGATAPGGSAVRLNLSTGSGAAATTAAPTPPASTAPAATAPATPAPVPATVAVPDVRGMKLLAARRAIRRAGLVTEWQSVPSPEPKGTVVSQSPKPGTTAKRGAHVLVHTSQGPTQAPPAAGQQPTVPDVTGEDEQTATQDLEAAGFTVQTVSQDTTDPSEDGIVIGQDPPGGQTTAAKSNVTITVAHYTGG